MKKVGLAFLMFSGVLCVGCSNQTYQGYADPKVDMRVREISAGSSAEIYDVLNEARSAVVGISVNLDDGYAVGSGVAISGGGYILTNFHVVEGGDDISLYFADKTKGSASVLWADPGLDMAVLKSSREIPYLSIESLDNLYIGQEVYAIGTPLTLEFKHTVTKGIISAMDRTLETASTYGASFLQSLVQHDASINPGNSGGPLIDSRGRVVGINTLKASEGEGIAFAIPIEIGKVVVDKISQNNSYQTPYIGVFGFDSALAEVHGQGFNEPGVYVVSATGPALQAGILKGDLIVSVDQQKISDMLDFRVAIYRKNIGDIVKLSVERDGGIVDISVKLTSRK